MRFSLIIMTALIMGWIFVAGQGHALTLKIATLSPDGSSWMQLMRQGAEAIYKTTDKRIRMKFYPGGVMGNDRAVLRKISIGQLQGGAVMSGSLSKLFPDNQIYNLPLKFNSFKEIDYIRKRMDRIIISGLKNKGFVAFGLAEGGFAYLMSKAPVKTLADLSKKKVWIPEGDEMAMEMVKVFNFSPIPLSIADVRTALQTGLIDTVATSPIGAIALQWHTQVKYLLNVPLMYIYGLLAIDQKALNKIAPDDQAIINDIMRGTIREMDRQNRSQNQQALSALHDQGIQFIELSNETLKELRLKGAKVSNHLLERKRLSPQIVNALNDYLSEYRAGKPETK